MKPIKTLALLALLISSFCLLPSAFALDIVTATIAVTNATGTTNGQTLTVNANVRTWTNSVYVPASQILTNETAAGAATNLFFQVAAHPFTGLSLARTTSTNITLQTAPGGSLTVTLSPGWGLVTYSTQSLVSATVVRVPNTVESLVQRTNVATGLTDWLNLTANNSALDQNRKVAEQLVGLGNNQTITGDKTFVGALLVSNRAGVFKIGTLYATNISGDVSALTNGVIWNAAFVSPSFTNGQNFGDPFRSPGTAPGSEQFGTLANATGTNATAIGYSADATGNESQALGGGSLASGESSTASGPNSIASGYRSASFGRLATATKDYATALGSGANASYTNSTAVGRSAVATTTNQIRLGTSTDHVSIPGTLRSFTAEHTNNFPAGSDIAFGRYAVTSLANGNNAAVPVGTNVFVEVSGPTGAFTINGLNADGAMRDGKLLVIVNQTGQDMTIAFQSGTDPTAANRIITMTGADRATTGNGVATLIYSATASRWLLISFDP